VETLWMIKKGEGSSFCGFETFVVCGVVRLPVEWS